MDRKTLRETVKHLALQYGQARAAEIANVNINTVKTWARRGHWNTKQTAPIAKQKHSNPTAKLIETFAFSPAEAYRSQITLNERRSKRALTSYLAKTSEILEKHKAPLKQTRRAKDLSDVHRAMYPPDTNTSQILNVAILTGDKEPRRIDAREVTNEANERELGL